MSVRVEVDGDLNSALRAFNRAVEEDGILKRARELRHYEKPSVERRREKKRRAAVRRKALIEEAATEARIKRIGVIK